MRLALAIALVLAMAGVAHAAPRCTALASCKTACTGGDGRSCRELGNLSLRATPVDLAGAAAAYGAGCDHSDAASCAALAVQVQDGRGVPWDQARAQQLYQRACDGGAGVGCFNLAIMFNEGNGVAADHAKAAALMARALLEYTPQCEAEPTWCVNIGYIYENGMIGAGPDYDHALAAYRKGCDHGDLDACASIASSTIDGRGIAKNAAAGVALLEKSCTAGGAIACGMLAGTIAGDDPRKAPPRVRTLMEQSCELGNAQSCGKIGAYYGMGVGGPIDNAKAARFQRRACDLGESLACMTEGEVLEQTDPRSAADFELRACSIGNLDGCNAIIRLTAAGKIKPDEAMKREVNAVECFHGQQMACDYQRAHPATH